MEGSDAPGSAEWPIERKKPATTVRLSRDDIARIEGFVAMGLCPSLSRFVADAIRDL